MKYFVCSLCHNGILGGTLYLDSASLSYKTNKLTVDMKNGESYNFIVFNKPRFEKWFQEYSHKIPSDRSRV